MRPLARPLAPVLGFVLGCTGLELFPDVEVRDATLAEAQEHFRVPAGASHIDAISHTTLDVESVRVCFTATSALLAAQRAEAQAKGATQVNELEVPASWPDFPGLLKWKEPDWWPAQADEVWRWDRGFGAHDDMGRGVLWTFTGDRACVWSWHMQFWAP